LARNGGSLSALRRLLALAVVFLLVGASGWLAWRVANPRTSDAPIGDAIFVHAGGNGERLRTAMALYEEGVAPVVVVSNPGGRSSQVPRSLCDSGEPIVCVTPSTIDTAGEARALASLAEEEGWDQVVVVTSDYHLARATVLDESCTDAVIEPVAAPARRRQPVVTSARVQEMLGLAYSWLFQTC
jgi:uncharacterized SAM-binding protein YcdF (DUF218 family)